MNEAARSIGFVATLLGGVVLVVLLPAWLSLRSLSRALRISQSAPKVLQTFLTLTVIVSIIVAYRLDADILPLFLPLAVASIQVLLERRASSGPQAAGQRNDVIG